MARGYEYTTARQFHIEKTSPADPKADTWRLTTDLDGVLKAAVSNVPQDHYAKVSFGVEVAPVGGGAPLLKSGWGATFNGSFTGAIGQPLLMSYTMYINKTFDASGTLEVGTYYELRARLYTETSSVFLNGHVLRATADFLGSPNPNGYFDCLFTYLTDLPPGINKKSFTVQVPEPEYTVSLVADFSPSFAYEVAGGGPNISAIALPQILSGATVSLWNGDDYVFAGELGDDGDFNFPEGGVDRFRVDGIALPPPPPDVMFPDRTLYSFVTFASAGIANVDMITPGATDPTPPQYDPDIPEPAAVVLGAFAGIAGLLLRRRGRGAIQPLMWLAAVAAILLGSNDASAGLMLRLSDDAGAAWTNIADNDLSDLNGLSGVIVFSGSVGDDWLVNVVTGISTPAIGSEIQPHLGLASVNINTSMGAASLVIQLCNDNLGPLAASGTFLVQGGGVLAPSDAVFRTWGDADNALFANDGTTAESFFEFANAAAFSFSGPAPQGGSLAAPYSLTLQAVITANGPGAASFNFELENAIPEPAALCLLVIGVGLLPLLRQLPRRASPPRLSKSHLNSSHVRGGVPCNRPGIGVGGCS
jgi:hypothetical protein